MESEGRSESTLGCKGSAQSGCEQIWGEELRQIWRGCSTQTEGRVQGPRGDAQGVQDNEAGEQSENEGSEGGDRAEGAWGHYNKGVRREDGGGIGWGDHFLHHKFIKRTFEC